jgi:hypothetical protein
LNFATPSGTHSYQIEVYAPIGGTMQLLGSKELNTKGKVKPCGHYDDDPECHNNGHERDCHYGQDDRDNHGDDDHGGHH